MHMYVCAYVRACLRGSLITNKKFSNMVACQAKAFISNLHRFSLFEDVVAGFVI